MRNVRDAIILKFGSIEEYAKHAGVSASNIYERIKRNTAKFRKQLIEDGITTHKERDFSTKNIGDNLSMEEQLTELQKQNYELRQEVTELKAKLFDMYQELINKGE